MSVSNYCLLYLIEEQTSDEEDANEGDLESDSVEEDPDVQGSRMQEDKSHSIHSDQEEEREQSASPKEPTFSFQAIDDLEKFAEGLDEVLSSEDEEDGSMERGSEDETGLEESEEEEEDVEESKDGGVLLTFSEDKVAEEVEKGKAVKNQIGW